MSQLSLVSQPVPPSVDGIDLRCCGVDEILDEVRGAALVHADPPWVYSQNPGDANPIDAGIYECLSMADIVRHLDRARDCVARSARMVCWYTWPTAAEWRAAGMAGPRWGPETSGGAWLKTGQVGVGYHWRGATEPIAMFTHGATGRPHELLLNGFASPPGIHSEKPVEWLRQMVRAWTKPGDLVLDLYAGMAPMARACALEGRRYVGAEIDAERHRAALDRLALRGAS